MCWVWLETDSTYAWYFMTFNTLIHFFNAHVLSKRVTNGWKKVWGALAASHPLFFTSLSLFQQWHALLELVQASTFFGLMLIWSRTSYKGLRSAAEFPFYTFNKSVCAGQPWAVNLGLVGW